MAPGSGQADGNLRPQDAFPGAFRISWRNGRNPTGRAPQFPLSPQRGRWWEEQSPDSATGHGPGTRLCARPRGPGPGYHPQGANRKLGGELRIRHGESSGGPMVRTLPLSLPRAQVQSLLREIHSASQEAKKRNRKKIQNSTGYKLPKVREQDFLETALLRYTHKP